MINYLFGLFIVIGIIYAFLTNNSEVIASSLTSSGLKALEMTVQMVPLLCLWLGVMKIASVSGLLKKMSSKLAVVIKPLFPELKKNGESLILISSNIVMNMFGLGNAATPFGLKAMEAMQKENDVKDTATRSMITFLIINTASVTLIPTTVISFRTLNGSSNPSEILPACIVTTVLSCLFGLLIDRICFYLWRKKHG